jgi:hypothetical protein
VGSAGGEAGAGGGGTAGGDEARALDFLGFGSFLSGLGLAEEPGAGIRYTRSSKPGSLGPAGGAYPPWTSREGST